MYKSYDTSVLSGSQDRAKGSMLYRFGGGGFLETCQLVGFWLTYRHLAKFNEKLMQVSKTPVLVVKKHERRFFVKADQ